MRTQPLCRLGAAVAVTVLAAGLAAQRVWIVDAYNRPGTHFTRIQPAVDAASHDDIVVVRAATYKRSVTVRKGIRVLGEPGARIELLYSLQGPRPTGFVVRDLPPGRTFALEGLGIYVAYRSYKPGTLLTLERNKGRVHVDGVKVGGSSITWFEDAIAVTSCASATLRNVSSTNGLKISDSTVAITGGIYVGKLTPGRPSLAANPGIHTSRSLVTLAGVRCEAPVYKYYNPSPAFRASASGIVVHELCSFRSMGIGVFLQSDLRYPSVLVLDPKLGLARSRISGFLTVTVRRMPSVRAVGGNLGGRLTVELRSAMGQVFAIFLGRSGDPTILAPFGVLWLDLGSVAFLGGGVQGAGELSRLSLLLPREPKLLGLPVAFQALSGAGPFLELSNPAVAILH